MTPDQIAELLACEDCAYDNVAHWRRIVSPDARRSWERAARQAMDRMKQAAMGLVGGPIGRNALSVLMRERIDDLAREMTGIEIVIAPADWPAYLESLDGRGWLMGESERDRAARRIAGRQKQNHRYIVKLARILALGLEHPAMVPVNPTSSEAA